MKANHTLSPWTLAEDGEIWGADETLVAQVYNTDHQDPDIAEEAMSNAELLCQAPRLLKLCRQALLEVSAAVPDEERLTRLKDALRQVIVDVEGTP